MNELLSLTWVFFKIGLFSIGGGYAIIPLIQEQVVDRFSWVSQKTFTDIITISQMTPGPLAVNTSTFIGIQIAGIPGAILATAGCVISGVLIAVFLYRFFKKHRQSHCVFQVLNGLKASSLGLIISAAGTILLLAFTGEEAFSLSSSWDLTAILLFAAGFFVLRRWKVHPILLLILFGAAGLILY